MEENVIEKKSIWTKDYVILFIGQMVAMSGQYLVNSLLSLYAKELGASDMLVGTVISAFYTVALCMRPLTGPAIDAWNRKRLYVVMMIMSGICMFGYSVSSSVYGILLFRCLHGISYGTTVALSVTMATQDADIKSITTAITTFTLSSTLPSAVGPALGLKMAEKLGYKLTYIVSGILMVMGACIALFLTNKKTEKKKYQLKLDSIISIPAIVPMVVLAFMGLASAAIQSFFALLVKSKDLPGLAGYYTANAIAMIVCRPLAGKLADKYGAKKLICIGLALFAADLALMSTCSNQFMVIFCGIIHAIGYSSSYSLIQALAMKVTPSEKRGAASSTCYIGMDLGTFLGGFLWGAVAEATDYASVFIFATLPQIISIFIILTWYRKNTKIANL